MIIFKPARKDILKRILLQIISDLIFPCLFLIFHLFSIKFFENRAHVYNNNNYNNVVSPARISLTLSRHFSQSFIASCRSSELHPVSSHNCCMYVPAGRPAFNWPYVGVHRSTSLMRSSLLLL